MRLVKRMGLGIVIFLVFLCCVAPAQAATWLDTDRGQLHAVEEQSACANVEIAAKAASDQLNRSDFKGAHTRFVAVLRCLIHEVAPRSSGGSGTHSSLPQAQGDLLVAALVGDADAALHCGRWANAWYETHIARELTGFHWKKGEPPSYQDRVEKQVAAAATSFPGLSPWSSAELDLAAINRESAPLSRDEQKLVDRESGSSTGDRAIVDLFDAVGAGLLELGESADAKLLYARAIALRKPGSVTAQELTQFAHAAALEDDSAQAELALDQAHRLFLSNARADNVEESIYHAVMAAFISDVPSPAALQMGERFLQVFERDFSLELAGDSYFRNVASSLVEAYVRQFDYASAIQARRNIIAFDSANDGRTHGHLYRDWIDLGDVYIRSGAYGLAEEAASAATSLVDVQTRPGEGASAFEILGQARLFQGNFPMAEMAYRQAAQLAHRASGMSSIDHAVAEDHLARLYLVEGRYQDAEPLLSDAFRIIKPQAKFPGGGPDSIRVWNAWFDVSGDLTRLYLMMGRPEKAPTYSFASTAFGDAVNWLLGNWCQCGESRASFHTSVADIYLSGSSNAPKIAHTKLRRFENAILLNLNVDSAMIGMDRPEVAAQYDALAAIYALDSDLMMAHANYAIALNIQNKIYGPGDWRSYRSLTGLAEIYEREGHLKDATKYFLVAADALKRQAASSFAYASESDRLSFLETTSEVSPRFLSFILRASKKNPELVAAGYDMTLWQRNVVGQSVALLQRFVAESGDKQATSLLDRIRQERSQLAMLAAVQGDRRPDRMQSLNAEINALEEQLARAVPAVASLSGPVTWRDVQRRLHSDEAAVEFLKFPYYERGRLEGRPRYIALILRNDGSPEFIQLPAAERLESISAIDFKRQAGLPGYSTQHPKSTLYDAFWKPLLPALRGATRIYLSPDGILSQIPVGVARTDSGSLLMEVYDIRIMTSSRDVVGAGTTAAPSPQQTRPTALLLGDPLFNMSDAEYRQALVESGAALQVATTTPIGGYGGVAQRDVSRSGKISSLPHTADEVNAVAAQLKTKGWIATTLLGSRALEETVKSATGPRVLHIASHGYFRSSEASHQVRAVSDDPMLRSGLLLAGAQRAWSRSAVSGLDDGILTAYEASTLNLHNTELVVLSACETGLGEVKGSEGVFGLRRGFHEAGARAIMMSMWKVPDRETQELMNLFYMHWLDGMDKHDALRHAELEERAVVKTRYGADIPYYWGAFVISDG